MLLKLHVKHQKNFRKIQFFIKLEKQHFGPILAPEPPEQDYFP